MKKISKFHKRQAQHDWFLFLPQAPMSQLGSGQDNSWGPQDGPWPLGFLGCNRNELQVHRLNSVEWKQPDTRILFTKIQTAQVARAGPQGAVDVMTGVLVMWLHSTCKSIKLHNTMPVVFSVYVMLLKEWKLNKTASMWLHQESLPITVWWHCSQRQNPESSIWEMRLKTLERRPGTGRRGEDTEQWDFIIRECTAPTPWQ